LSLQLLEWIGTHFIIVLVFSVAGSAGYVIGMVTTRWLSRPMHCARCGLVMHKRRFAKWKSGLKS
jgi:hypothetical protein